MTNTTTSADRLLLEFDGYNIVRRVYGAVPGEDSQEKVEGAFRSSLGSFKRALKEFQPTHVFAAFDHGGPAFGKRDVRIQAEETKPGSERGGPVAIVAAAGAGIDDDDKRDQDFSPVIEHERYSRRLEQSVRQSPSQAQLSATAATTSLR